MSQLDILRESLGQCDEILLDALLMRNRIVEDIMVYKEANDIPILQPEQEAKQKEWLARRMEGKRHRNEVDAVFEEKKDESNAMRIEQAVLLLEDLSRNPMTLLGGAGLGNTVDVTTHFRSYVGATYYELQVLYVLNQLGLVSFLVFILVNILFVFKYMPDTKIKMVYAGYVLYAVTNPYIIDTNQVVVIITLLSAQYQISNHLPPIWKK